MARGGGAVVGGGCQPTIMSPYSENIRIVAVKFAKFTKIKYNFADCRSEFQSSFNLCIPHIAGYVELSLSAVF